VRLVDPSARRRSTPRESRRKAEIRRIPVGCRFVGEPGHKDRESNHFLHAKADRPVAVSWPALSSCCRDRPAAEPCCTVQPAFWAKKYTCRRMFQDEPLQTHPTCRDLRATPHRKTAAGSERANPAKFQNEKTSNPRNVKSLSFKNALICATVDSHTGRWILEMVQDTDRLDQVELGPDRFESQDVCLHIL
jgi:hypothetical protein